MAAFTSKASGGWSAEGQTTWSEAGHPTAAGDTAAIGAHAITAPTGDEVGGLGAITIAAGGSLTLGAFAFTCGAITCTSTGAFTSGAGLLTCGTITKDTGNVTIGTGGADLGANNLVNGSATGTLTNNGTVTMTGTFTPRTCNMNANVSCASISVAGITLVQAAGTTLSGMTSSVSSSFAAGSSWTVGAGCTISFTSASNLIISVTVGTFTCNGTQANPVTFTNTDAGEASLSVTSGTITATWTNLKGTVTSVTTDGGTIVMSDCALTGTSAAAFNIGTALKRFYINRIWIANMGYITGAATGTTVRPAQCYVANVAIGYTTAGVSSPPEVGIAPTQWHSITNCIINATAQVTVTASTMGGVAIDNLGYIDPAMLPGTGSALDLAVVGPGVYTTWAAGGQQLRVTTNSYPSQTHNVRVLSHPTATTSTPWRVRYRVPIRSGQKASVVANVSRHTLSSDAVVVVIDPDKTWFNTTVSSAELITNADAYTPLSAKTAVGARGTTNRGMLEVQVQVTEYGVGEYVDIGLVAITVGGYTYMIPGGWGYDGEPSGNAWSAPIVRPPVRRRHRRSHRSVSVEELEIAP